MVIAGTIPGLLAIIVLVTFVRERRKEKSGAASGNVAAAIRTPFSNQFKVYLAVASLFTLGNSSDFFLILKAQNVETPLFQVCLMLVLFNLTYSVIALPMGMMSDKLGRRRILVLGWSVYGLAYIGFALATHVWQVWLLFAFYGLYYGISEGAAKAFVADMVPAERRGTAYGLYNGVTAFMALGASLLAGWIWQAVNPAAAFYLGAGLALLAMMGILFIVREGTLQKA
jgi:MFS family permease